MLLAVNGVVRIGTEIETRFTQEGKQITSFSVVSSDKYKTSSGEKREDSCFIKVTAFGGLAKVISDYCHKGSKISISASLKQDKWEDQQGNKKSLHSLKIEKLEMLDSKQDNQASQQTSSGEVQHPQATRPPYHQSTPTQAPPSQPAPSSVSEIDINEDEIPF